MQLEFIFQNPVVILVVIFGMSCTMGLAVVIPIVANVILAVFGGWVGDLAQAAQGKTRDSAYPSERDDFPKQVIGYAPGEEPKAEMPAPAPLVVEADEVPVAMLTQLTVAVTLTAAAFVFIAVLLFEWRLETELADKGYEDVEVIPHVAAQ
ncbi:MAG: hypothetical protein CL927_12570 [Deltaproteobacteria bacterium]|nr:hypothetical protein [Deltaproteobacteria bacterium]HCH61575.1 hypothetical protein [Deltaproteobacteria bacterium]|tara:strand:+ start:157 stop:609 length:453 start_codon:yes stop_codon:yes gene_type:complete